MSEPQLYRRPPDPGGYIGGYNWGPALAGLGLLGLSNLAATQWIAHRFAYQAALGQPWVSINRIGLYSPFRWIAWVWRYGSVPDAAVRLPLLFGSAIVIVGSILTIGIFGVLNVRRAKRLTQNAEDLHGSARWAGEKEVKATGLLAARHGVYVGGWYDRRRKRIHYLRHDGPEHVLAFAPTRTGKGVGLVIPTLLAWNESAVIYDIKGENWAKTAGYRHSQGHLCFKFSPVEQSTSRFNPLAEIRLGTPRDVSDAQNAADMIVRTGQDSPQERYWQDAAASITAGMILHVCYAAAAEGLVASLGDLAGVFTRPGSSFRDTLNELLNYPHDPDLGFRWHTPDGETAATHPVVREKVQEMLDKEDKDFSGVLSTAKTAMALYSDPLVSQNTSASDFTINDLVNNDSPVSLYLVVPPSDKIRLRPLIRLMFTMIVNRLTERMAFEGSDQVRNKHRLLFLIDEFPSLHRMELFADALSYMAGYGLKAYLITQDIRQIVDQYGPNESIVSNCHVRVAFAPNQYDTAELLSKMTGNTTVQKATFNFSGSRLSPVMNHVNASVDQIERPLMTPDEVMRLRPPTKEGQGSAERIIAPGDMLIFMAGHHPIYGTQMLYFTDPILRSRSAVAAPLEPITLVDGKPQSQLPLARTVHVMSHPEELTPSAAEAADNATSPMEEAFSQEMNAGMGNSSAKLKQPQTVAALPEGYLEELESRSTSELSSKRQRSPYQNAKK
jgi:type IV secretion system protein VirD4